VTGSGWPCSARAMNEGVPERHPHADAVVHPVEVPVLQHRQQPRGEQRGDRLQQALAEPEVPHPKPRPQRRRVRSGDAPSPDLVSMDADLSGRSIIAGTAATCRSVRDLGPGVTISSSLTPAARPGPVRPAAMVLVRGSHRRSTRRARNVRRENGTED
jgi:hypothetical protein